MPLPTEASTPAHASMASMDGKIAIIGMACRFPGGAHDPESFWELLKSGVCTMEDVPSSRFDINDYWCKDGDENNKMMARKAHFLRDASHFDEAFFNLSPREALNMDPQHRVLMETVVDGLDDAGYKPADEGGEGGWVKSRMGIFVASATDSYQHNLMGNIEPFFIPGMVRGFASGRISYHFGWEGPAIVYDTACSSALVTVHYACQSLLLNECDAAVASGTNLITSPEVFVALSRGFFVSNTGGCRAFDESADGYCRAEGVGVLVLKRLADAVRDNDKIDGIIIASGTNQSGTAESLTKPHAPTQARLFASNLRRAGVSPLAVRVVETHGTGTQAGDDAELEAIKQAYCPGRPSVASEDAPPDGIDDTRLFICSLKPNVGHCESASGLASTIKAVLMMKHGEMLPHTGITTRRNPRLGNLEADGIVIPSKSHPLKPVAGQERVIISVNNFGAPGGNANVLLEDAAPVTAELPKDPRTHHIVVISAKPHTPFSTITQRLLDHLENAGDIDLASLSYTTTARRVDHSSRLALSVSSIDDLKQQLRKSPPPIARQSKSAPRIGFVLGGNGSQHKDMGKTLYETSPVFREHMDHCDAALRSHGGPGILGVVTGQVDPLAHDFESHLAAAASVFSIGYSLGMLWKHWGVTPSVIMGHSLGEYAGLALAGCLSVDDAMKLIVCKCKSVHTSEIKDFDGGMLAVGVSTDDAQRMVDQSGCSGLEVSCFNAPAQSCVSGPKSELLKLQAYAKALPEPPLSKILPGFVSWHSSHLKEPASQLAKAAEKITFTEAEFPMLRNIDGTVLQPGEVPASSYLADQMKMPVRFDLCATHPLAQSVDIWIELSAKAILLPLVRQFVPAGRAFLPSLGGQGTESWSFITKALSRLYEAHVPIKWATYHNSYPVRLVSLPSYPFARNPHWVPYQDRLNVKPAVPSANSVSARTEAHREIVSTPLGSLEILKPWKRYLLHTGGHHLSPGAYLWLALTCTKAKRITNLQVTNPEGAGTYLTVHVEGSSHTGWSVSFVRHDVEHSTEGGLVVASCGAGSSGDAPVHHETENLLARSRVRLTRNPTSSFFSKAMASKMLAASKDSFGSLSGLVGQPLESLTVSDDGEEGLGMIHWPGLQASTEQGHPCTSRVPFSPSQLRSLLQPACLLFFLSPATTSSSGPYSIDQFDVFRECTEDKTLDSAQSLSSHVFLQLTSDKAGRQAANTKSYICSQSGSPLVRVTGFRRSRSSRSVSSSVAPPAIAIDVSPPSSPESLSSASSLGTGTTSPITPPQEKADPIEDLDIAIKSLSHSTPAPVPTPKAVAITVATTGNAALTEEVMIATLAEELGIPVQSVSPEDMLEDMGVDSIMSLLLRDKFSKMCGRRLKWFDWTTGMTVHEFWDKTAQAVRA